MPRRARASIPLSGNRDYSASGPPLTLKELPTPCYIVDIAALRGNLEILRDLAGQTGCSILLAQKAFSMFALYPLIGDYLDGTTASGLFEARLGAQAMGKENHVYAPAFRAEDMPELIRICDHIVFNSFEQERRFGDAARSAGCSVGIRINPRFSTQDGPDIYDPCATGSRLGTTLEHFEAERMRGVEGLHFHTLCEQDSDALEQTFEAFERDFGGWFKRLRWLNLGGGHHITRSGYDIQRLARLIRRIRETYGVNVYLEPGEAVALNAGTLRSKVLAIVENDLRIAILDTSATCHMPDVLEMPYRPPLTGSARPGEKPFAYRLAGPTCLAGDVIGDYAFDRPLAAGDALTFGDMAIYTMVKNNTFNGMPLPAIVIRDEDGAYYIQRRFGYEDFKNRLS